MRARYNNEYNISSINHMSSSLILKSISNFSKRYRILSTSYVIGLIFILLIGNGFQISSRAFSQYNRIMNTIDVDKEFNASHRLHMSYSAYTSSKGWFSCDDLCQRNKRRYIKDKRRLDAVRREGYNKMSQAKSIVGLFSTIGIEELKDCFWNYFSQGLKFAKRQSIWDMMFMSIRSITRDESLIEYILKIGFQIFINLSMGLCMCFVFFLIGLWSVVKSYSSSPLVSAAYYILCVCAAFSFIVTCWMIMTCFAIASVVGLGKVVSHRSMLGNQSVRDRHSRYDRVSGQTSRSYYQN